MKKAEYIEKYGIKAYERRKDHLEEVRENKRLWKKNHPEEEEVRTGGERSNKMEKEKESFGGFAYNPQKGLVERVEEEFKEDFVGVEEGKEEKEMNEGKKEEVKEEQEVKEETKEEKKERYIDILVGIGFLKGKEKGDGKERYYYKIDDNSAVGRTFDSRTPLGKFWAKVDGEWLKECRDLEIVKRFYAIREGKEGMPERPKEIAKREPATVERKIGEVDFKVRGDYYTIRGQKEPGAWLVQQWANKVKFSDEIIDEGTFQDEKHAQAHVRVHHPKGYYCDAIVNHNFVAIRDVIMLDLINEYERKEQNIVSEYDEEGKPKLIPEAQQRFFSRYIHFKNFSLRDATTKAIRIAQMKLLNQEWRETEEVNAEEMEVKAVAGGK